MKKQQFKTALLSTFFIAMLGLCVEGVFAQSQSGGGGHDGGHAGGRSGGGSEHDNGAEELNHDNVLQGAEISSQQQHRRHATPVNQLRIGEPRNPNNGYNQTREYLKEHR